MSDAIKPNVLLVDDEEQFLDLLSQRLGTRGVHTETAISGEDAVSKVKNTSFDAVILDMMMPGMGGLETLRKIREQNPEVQIIMLTGRGTIEKAVEAMKEGAVDFLEKPTDIETLLNKIEEAKEQRILLVMKNIEEKVKGLLRKRP